ncbi:hypothetical protein CORT_0B09580 [Candida orthopsilosis Co 90-125]|uniref:FAS1 domain-containing protein n=1 Tax=Candida orthopsilosis (strain 90-125) TaxID=1136231 RepID=H8X0F0_CANO9|nr:hypothetical protein CORT_0B09580 [Candida orthopsilosis Co 90-125]CCG22662.1 hypothetical protein CORT_0B09580 [Candida orthopsilosis Co 90-125]
MRATIIALVASLSSMVVSKNVYNLHALDNHDQASNDKRDAKNVPHLDNLKVSSENGKRDAEPKNVINLQDLKIGVNEEENEKRDAKNTPNLVDLSNKFLHDESDKDLAKRKNTFRISDFIHEENHDKRDAKNTFKIAKFAKASTKKRDGQEVLNLPDGEETKDDYVFTFNSADCYNNLLQSILPQLKSVSIFAGYIRDNKELNSRTESLESNMLIVSPTDDAIENKLSNLKPWEFPASLNEAKTEQEQDKILQDNLQNYLDGHIVIDLQDKISIEDGNEDKEKIVVTKLNNGELLEIKQDIASQTFSVRVAAKQKKWIPVVTVRQVENGFIFVIDDSLVKP